MDENIYCNNADCPYKDCNQSVRAFKKAKDKTKTIRVGNLGGICRRYIYWIVNEVEMGRR